MTNCCSHRSDPFVGGRDGAEGDFGLSAALEGRRSGREAHRCNLRNRNFHVIGSHGRSNHRTLLHRLSVDASKAMAAVLLRQGDRSPRNPPLPRRLWHKLAAAPPKGCPAAGEGHCDAARGGANCTMVRLQLPIATLPEIPLTAAWQIAGWFARVRSRAISDFV
jgi:hypothetical protein